jgi:hypothetical protein
LLSGERGSIIAIEVLKMTSRRLACFAIVAVFGLFSAAAVRGQDIAYSAVPGTHFAKFKTYAWGDIARAVQLDPAIEPQIRHAVEAQLAAKGLTRTEGPSDLLAIYEITEQPARKGFQIGSDMGVGDGSSLRYTATSTPAEAITVGLYDRTAKRFVWRGGATKAVDEKQQDDVDTAVRKLFTYYPPPEK